MPEDEIGRILATAAAAGVTLIDTAAAYGHSEAALGRCLPACGTRFRIVTKVASLPPAERAKHARQSMQQSLRQLGKASVHGILLHRHDDLAGAEGEALYEEMRTWQQDGLVEKIGISVYEGREAERVLERFKLDIVQLPVNLFDQRSVQDGSMERLAQRGVELHARSIFLQGLLLMEPATLPSHLAAAKEPLSQLRLKLASHGLTPLQGALSFAQNLSALTQIIVGVHSRAHLFEILQANEATVSFDGSEYALTALDVLDPRQWRQP